MKYLLALLLLLPTAQDRVARPNVLWLIGEDLGPELGCYGTEQVWTPNPVSYTHLRAHETL